MERGFPTCKTISQAGLFNPIQESLRFDFTSGRLHFAVAPHGNLQTLARQGGAFVGKGRNETSEKYQRRTKKQKKNEKGQRGKVDLIPWRPT